MSAGLDYWILSQVAWITDQQQRRLQAALALTGSQCAAAWNQAAPTFNVASKASDIPAASVPIVFSQTMDQPGDLAWHAYLDGRPYCSVLADQAQVSIHDVETGASHEVNESIADALCEGYVPLADGSQIALENSDPVEGDTIPVDLGDSGEPVQCSNYVLPAWFKADSPPGTKLDAMGLCTQPLIVRPNGYAMLVDKDGSTRQIGQGPAAYKRHPAFRYGRRLASMHAMAMKIRLGRAA